jgi:hypothetical protein
VPRHLESAPDPSEEETFGPAEHEDDGSDDVLEPLRRPPWWRWVAIVVIVSMVVATPFAYGLYLVFR